MTVVYKWTDFTMKTYGGFQFGMGEWHRAIGTGQTLCSDGFIHWYQNPRVAVLMRQVHFHDSNPRLFRAEARGDMRSDGGLKGGSRSVRLVQEIKPPVLTLYQRALVLVRMTQDLLGENTHPWFSPFAVDFVQNPVKALHVLRFSHAWQIEQELGDFMVDMNMAFQRRGTGIANALRKMIFRPDDAVGTPYMIADGIERVVDAWSWNYQEPADAVFLRIVDECIPPHPDVPYTPPGAQYVH